MDTIPLPKLESTAATEPIPAAPTELPPASGPEPGEKKKRHRRTKAEIEAERAKLVPPTPAAPVSDEDLARCRIGFAMIFGLISKALTKKWGDDMALSEEEVGTLAGVWTDAVAPYLPQAGKSMPLATAAVATLLIALPRWDAYHSKKTEAAVAP